MKKYKKHIIIGSIIIAVLVFAFWWGGDAPSLRGWNVEPTPKATERAIIDEVYDNDESPTPTVEPTISPTSSPTAENSEKIQNKPTADKPMTAEEKIELAEEIAGEPYEEIYTPDLEYSENNGMNIDETTGTDEYKTEPVPEGKPVPVEPQDAVIESRELTCTLAVRCDTILDNMSWLDKEKWELVPSDGVIFKEQTVEFYDGESVFDLLQREMKNSKIHMEFENTPMYNSAYIEGIGNLYEFDCGELSGWMYKVNDWFPNYGCSRYQLKQGDKVEWVYTCNLGIDVGGYSATGGEWEIRQIMNEFAKYHPLINFIYFTAVIVFSMIFVHPICLVTSLLCSVMYSVILNGKKALKFIAMLLPLMLISALINPAFNHEGVTVIAYLPSGNPLTLESILYGIVAASMVAMVICWFSCFNKIMTSDKFIYLFGRIIPSLSLILSMTFRFVPKFKEQVQEVSNAQKSMGRDSSEGSVFARVKNSIRILSAVITWSLENAIDTSDSMKSRGYGLTGRTAYSNYVFDKRDVTALIYLAVTITYFLIGALLGKINYRYFPSMRGTDMSFYSTSIFISYIMICIMPIIIEIWEELKWRKLKSKI